MSESPPTPLVKSIDDLRVKLAANVNLPTSGDSMRSLNVRSPRSMTMIGALNSSGGSIIHKTPPVTPTNAITEEEGEGVHPFKRGGSVISHDGSNSLLPPSAATVDDDEEGKLQVKYTLFKSLGLQCLMV